MTAALLLLAALLAGSDARPDSSACELAKGMLTQEDLDQNKAFEEGKSFVEGKDNAFICRPETLAVMTKNVAALQKEIGGIGQIKAACSEDAPALRAADGFGSKLQARLDRANEVVASIKKACPATP